MDGVANAQEQSNKWLIIITIMLVAILEVLDSTIVNVALPAMMPALGANQEEITWVLTSYVVASAVMLPLTGFLSNRIGVKNLLLIDITGFMISSFLCGFSDSLTMMVIFRLFQGAFGAALIPLSQSILRQSFPIEEQGKAMAIWGMGIMVAPVFGPTLGGYITEYSSWRWVFYINTPFCLLGALLTIMVVPKSKAIYQKIDWFGILLMFAGIGALQIMLDQGNNKDWFSSNIIITLAAVSIVGICWFILRSAFHKNPVINLVIFKDRNFTISTIMLAVFAGALFGLVTLEPIMLETLLGYDTVTAGLTMMPLGLFSAFGMLLASQLMSRVNIKILLTFALIFCLSGSYYLSTLTLQTMQENILIGNAITGFGMGLFMVPLSTYSLITIQEKYITEAAGLFSYGRMLGTSIGISLLSTLVTRVTQINWHELGLHISNLNSNLRLWLQHAHMKLQDPQTLAILSKEVYKQANMLAFLDAFLVIAISFIVLIFLTLFLKSVKIEGMMPGGH